MKYILSLFITLCTAFGTMAQSGNSAGQANAEASVNSVSSVTYANTITEQELKDHLYTYASDEFMGRETGTEGERLATDYLAGVYEDIGVEPANENGDYHQSVSLLNYKQPSGEFWLGDNIYVLGEDLIPLEQNDVINMETVYVKYGIETESYSDYNDLDITDKAVIMITGEPKNEDGTYVISGTTEESKWSKSGQEKIQIAAAKGAKVVIFITKNYKNFKAVYDRVKNSELGGQLFLEPKSTSGENLVLFAASKSILPDTDVIGPHSFGKLRIGDNRSVEKVSSNNIVAFIQGKTKPDEYIVISAHLDHDGKHGTEIYNGADDDGSGTVALLEIAEAFKQAVSDGYGPDRSIVFLHVTAEEKGLFGSQFYTENPIFPLENTIANLNIDMIGRIDPKRDGDRNYIYLIGTDMLSSELHELSEKVNRTYVNMELDYSYNDKDDPNRFYYRSDHYNFAKNDIPVIFYFNGTHDDYHQPSDTPDKINYDLMTNRCKLIFHTAWELANRPERIKLDKIEAE